MGKKYSEVSDKQRTLEDPAACISNNSLHALVGEERILEGTMSVDAYFDELIEQVRQDYAAL